MEKIQPEQAGENLSQKITEIISSRNFGERIEVVPVTNPEIINDLKNSAVGGLDFRVKAEGDENTSSVFEGLAFDPEHLRTQSFALYRTIEGKRLPVAITTIIIAPKKIVSQERYWEKTTDGIILRDFEDLQRQVHDEPQMPEFMIEPAWTKVDPAFLTKFAIPGFRAIREILELLREVAPPDTYVHISAQGRLPYKEGSESKFAKLLEVKEVGTTIKISELPPIMNGKEETPLMEAFGSNIDGSRSTVGLAEILKIPKVENFADQKTLGPIFIQKAK